MRQVQVVGFPEPASPRVPRVLIWFNWDFELLSERDVIMLSLLTCTVLPTSHTHPGKV